MTWFIAQTPSGQVFFLEVSPACKRDLLPRLHARTLADQIFVLRMRHAPTSGV